MSWNKDDYTARIAGAAGAKLTVITFEIAVNSLDDALRARASERETFEREVRRARACVNYLMESLDMRYDISRDLMSLYIYMTRLLSRSFFSREAKPLEEVKNMLGALREGFAEADRQQGEDDSSVPQIYAGLTYKNGEMVEYVDEKQARGFRA